MSIWKYTVHSQVVNNIDQIGEGMEAFSIFSLSKTSVDLR